jgi:ATP phosphoribosyltransferase regulatory subunit
LSKFGPSLPATGFALVIDRLLTALERRSAAVEEQVPDYFITGDDLRSVFRKAKELREEGFIVEVDVSERSRQEAIAYASRKGIPQILVIENSETVER